MKRSILGVILAAGLGLAACDSGSTGTNDDETIAIALGSATGQIQQGGTLVVPVTVTRSGGFAGAVTLAAEGLPAGVTAATTTVAAGATAGTLTLSATGAAAPTTANITIRATGAGVSAATAAMSLTLAARGAYTLAAEPGTMALVQGASADAAIAITRTGGFTGTVALAAAAPAGITATLAPATVTGTASTATLSIAASANVAPGTYPVTVTGTSAGIANQTTTVNVTISAPGSYTLAIAPGTLSLAAGTQGTANVTITRQAPFAAAVVLTATAPAGITATVAPASVTGTTATVTVAVGAAVAAGNYTVTLTGAAAGVTPQTATLSVQVTPAGSFSLGLAPTSLQLAQGSTGNTTVNVTRAGGFTGPVTVTAAAPAGLTATVATPEVTGASTTVSVAVGAAVAAGSYNVTVRGNAAGMAEQVATLAVTVSNAGGFTIALAPAALAVQQGANGTSQVTVARTGSFTGDVALTATAPAGVTVTFAPASVVGATTQSTMTVAVAPGTAVGASQITVRANSAGQAEQTATLALTVNASQGGAGNVVWQFCGFSGLPQFVAVQDGDGAWTRVTGNASNQYTFQISSGRGGVAYVVPFAGGMQTRVFYGTTAELQSQGEGICYGTAGGKTVTGSIAGVGAFPLEGGFLTLGRTQVNTVAASGPFTMNGVLEGPLDLIGSKAPVAGAAGFGPPSRFLIQRNLNPANNGSIGTIDLNTGFAPATSTVTFTNLAGGELSGTIGTYNTPRNTQGYLFMDGNTSSSATRNWYGFPTAQRQPGELHVVNAIATDPAAATPGNLNIYTRQVMFVEDEVGPKTVTLGPIPAAPTVTTVATAPYVRMRITFNVLAEYNRYFTTVFDQGENGSAQKRSVEIQKTNTYVNAGGAQPMEGPDLSGAAGWNNDWGLKTGVQTFWTITATGWTGGGVTSPVLVDGATLLSGTRQGLITP